MSKSRRHRDDFYEDESDSHRPRTNKNEEKRLQAALKSRNIDQLIQDDDPDCMLDDDEYERDLDTDEEWRQYLRKDT